MSSAKQVVSNAFESSASERLARFIAGQGITGLEITPLTPDASTRKYFRVPWKKGKAVAAVYPEAFDPEFHPYLDVTRLFRDAQIPVPDSFRDPGYPVFLALAFVTGGISVSRMRDFVTEMHGMRATPVAEGKS